MRSCLAILLLAETSWPANDIATMNSKTVESTGAQEKKG
jgi:hypothetical protein